MSILRSFYPKFNFIKGSIFDVLGHDVWEVKKANFDQTRVKLRLIFWQIRVHLPSAVPGWREEILGFCGWFLEVTFVPELRGCVRGVPRRAQSTESPHLLPGNLHKNWPVSCLGTGQGGPVTLHITEAFKMWPFQHVTQNISNLVYELTSYLYKKTFDDGTTLKPLSL